MTRLNNELRRQIIDKIMAQVPVIDYAEKIKEFLNEQARKMAPPKIMKLEGTPDWAFVAMSRAYVERYGYFLVCPLPSVRSHNRDELRTSHPDPAWRALAEALKESGLVQAADKQDSDRKSMRAKLMQVMQSTTTVKGLRKVLAPDLHQFVPVDVEASANLPVPAIAAELRAMGMQFPSNPAG